MERVSGPSIVSQQEQVQLRGALVLAQMQDQTLVSDDGHDAHQMLQWETRFLDQPFLGLFTVNTFIIPYFIQMVNFINKK